MDLTNEFLNHKELSQLPLLKLIFPHKINTQTKHYSKKIKNLDNFILNHKSWDKNNLMSWINSLRNWKMIKTIILKNLLELFKIIKLKKSKLKFYKKKFKNLRSPWLKKLKKSKQNMIWKYQNLNESLLNNNKTSQSNKLQLLVLKPIKKL